MKERIERYIQKLVETSKYRPLTPEGSKVVRKIFTEHLPPLNNKEVLYTINGLHLSDGFTRVVVGDYGAFIEIAPEQINLKALKMEPGQAYRLESWFNGKYIWYTDSEEGIIKVYHQLRGVSYADYKPNMYYISPYEVVQR